jgi:hypothetical protein
MESLSRCVRSSFPEQGVTCHVLYTLERCATLPTNNLKPECIMGYAFPFKLPWFEAQLKIQANHCPSPQPRCPPFVTSFGHMTYAQLPSLLIHISRHPAAQDGDVTGSHPLIFSLNHSPTKCTRTDERKKVQLTFPSHYRICGQRFLIRRKNH